MRSLAAILLVALAVPLVALAVPGATALAARPDAERRAQLTHLLRHDCGSCHGMRLTGGLGPALTPAAICAKPRALLRQAILAGRPGTPMPPWQGLLSEDEVAWLVELLCQGGLDDG